jgi:hypothetical protein
LGDNIQFNNTSPPIPLKSHYGIKILPELSIQEKLSIFVNLWITPIGGLWSFADGMAAVIAPLIIQIYGKKNKK